jgi:hypothetical protein
MGIKLDPEAVYAEHTLRTHGLDEDTLREARRSGSLAYSELRRGLRVYKGSDLLAWIASRRTQEGMPA